MKVLLDVAKTEIVYPPLFTPRVSATVSIFQISHSGGATFLFALLIGNLSKLVWGKRFACMLPQLRLMFEIYQFGVRQISCVSFVFFVFLSLWVLSSIFVVWFCIM